MSSGMGRQLAGVRVLDLTRVLAGPFCTMILGDLGAEVIKIESPGDGDQTRRLPPFVDGYSPYFTAVNRTKKSVTIDLKSDGGQSVVRNLVRHSDVVVENFRSGVMERLGLGPAALRELRPDIISCSISGFGEGSPLRDSPSFDLIIQALSGVMSLNGDPTSPPTRLGIPMGDLSGGLWAAIGVLAALNHRQATGEGQHIDLSLLDSLMSLLGYNTGLALSGVELMGRVPHSGHESVVPYGCYPTQDGHLTVAVYGDQFWGGFCRALDRPAWAADPRFATVAGRRDHRDLLESELVTVLAARPSAEWEERLTAEGVPHAPVLDVRSALLQEHVKARHGLFTLGGDGGPPAVRTPIRSLDDTGLVAHALPPGLGEHTTEVLSSVLGMSADDIAALAASGAVSTGEPG